MEEFDERRKYDAAFKAEVLRLAQAIARPFIIAPKLLYK